MAASSRAARLFRRVCRCPWDRTACVPRTRRNRSPGPAGRPSCGARVEEPLILSDIELAAVVDRDNADPRALLLRQHLPRHDVRVMLERGEYDLVAPADELAAVTMRDEIDTFGGSTRENDLVLVGRVDEALRLATRRLVLGSRFLRQVVH